MAEIGWGCLETQTSYRKFYSKEIPDRLTTELRALDIWLSPKRGLTSRTRSTPSLWFVLKHLAP